MRRSLTALTLAGMLLALSGCLGNSELVARWEKICTDQGFVQGTPEFQKCWDDNRPRQTGGAVDFHGGP